MRQPLLPVLSLILAFTLASTAAAQCAKLRVWGGAAGKRAGFDISKAPDRAITYLVIGLQGGRVNVPIGNLGVMKFGVLPPFNHFYVGRTDAKGELDRSFYVPKGNVKTELFIQAMVIDVRLLPFKVDYCETNTVKVLVGGS